MARISKFTGLNNVSEPNDAGSGDLQKAVNVTINNSGSISRRTGFLEMYSGDAHSAHASGSSVFFVDGTDLILYHPTTPVTILGNMQDGALMGYCNLNGKTYFSNGYQRGVIENLTSRSWGLAAPPTPAVSGISGQMSHGTYQVCLTYLRNDGQESGCSTPVDVDAKSGGIRVTSISPSADSSVIGIVVYITSSGGEIRGGDGLYRYITIRNSSGQTVDIVDSASIGNGYECRTFNTYPPPLGTIVFFYRGRMYVVSGDTIYWSLLNMFENFSLDEGLMKFQGNVKVAIPLENGIWVGTENEVMFLFGKGPDIDGGFDIRGRANIKSFAGGSTVSSDMTGIRDLYRGTQAIWVTDIGVVIGDGNGLLHPMTSSRWVPTSATGGVFGCVVKHGGESQYVFGLAEATTVVYSMNVKNGAVCEWDKVFTSAASIGDDIYATTTDGLLVSGQDTDDGVDIDAEIEKQGLDFGTYKDKRLAEVYILASMVGRMLMTVSSQGSSGQSYTYSSVSSSPKTHKFHAPKGVGGRNITINIKNVDGISFYMKELEPIFANM